jgi:hypothetical protein
MEDGIPHSTPALPERMDAINWRYSIGITAVRQRPIRLQDFISEILAVLDDGDPAKAAFSCSLFPILCRAVSGIRKLRGRTSATVYRRSIVCDHNAD